MKPCTLLNAKICFATRPEGQAKISTPDVYTDRLSDYELQAKVRRRGAVTRSDYFKSCRGEVRSWSLAETDYLCRLIGQMEKAILEQKLEFKLPEEIIFVKTTGWEEGGANGYTRENAIYLNEDSLSYHLLLHEMFHVISRTDPALATRAYQVLGFRETPEVEYDNPFRVSNPDAPFLRHVIEVRYRTQPIFVCLVIRGIKPYDGGSFFNYISKKLLVLEQREGRFLPRIENRSTLFLDYHEVDGLFQNIGRNTAYNIHQEEVTAVHFEYLLMRKTGLPHPHLIEGLRQTLSNNP